MNVYKYSRDRWDYYQEYLNCCFELYKSCPTILEEAHKTLCEVSENLLQN